VTVIQVREQNNSAGDRGDVEDPHRSTGASSGGVSPSHPTGESEVPVTDMWTRTPPEYRNLTIVMLTVNIVLFAALGCFTYWLRTGDPYPLLRPIIALFGDPPAAPRYPYGAFWKGCLNPFGSGQVTLTDFLVFPISVEHVPAHMVIVGLLMASLVTIPILVAMLYRLPVAVVFLLIVGFVAVFPWLALTLLVSCVIATARPFRFSFRYATVLLALLPVVIYFFAATRGALASAVALAGPVERMKLYIPWVLALMASCLGSAIVLGTAYLINYRPGAIAPLLAVLFAIPAILFVTQVGADEMEYRLLEYDYGPAGTRVFADLDTKALLQRTVELELLSDVPEESREVEAVTQNKWLLLRLAMPTELARQQDEVVERCDDFLARYPASRYVPNCLYLRGRALDMRIDMDLLRRDLRLDFYSDFPSEASRETWKELLRSAPESPFASVAGLNLALLEAREGRLRLAQDVLRRVTDRFSKPPTTMPEAPSVSGLRALLARKPPSSTLNVDPQTVAEKAAQILSLIRENYEARFEEAAHPDQNPISLLLRCDPRDPFYPDNVLRIDRRFPGSKLHDNLMVHMALGEPDINTRRSKLLECAKRYRDGDAAPHAIYELGLLELEHNRKAEGREALELLLKQYPGSPWTVSAQRRLLAIEVAPKAK